MKLSDQQQEPLTQPAQRGVASVKRPDNTSLPTIYVDRAGAGGFESPQPMKEPSYLAD